MYAFNVQSIIKRSTRRSKLKELDDIVCFGHSLAFERGHASIWMLIQRPTSPYVSVSSIGEVSLRSELMRILEADCLYYRYCFGEQQP